MNEEVKEEKTAEAEENLADNRMDGRTDDRTDDLADDRTNDEVHEQISGQTKLVTDQGLTADKYCVSEPWIDSNCLSEEEEEELSGIPIEYEMKKEEVVPGMRAFQHKVSFKKNMIYTVILAVLAALYLHGIIKDPSYTTGIILFGLCLLVILMIWYSPEQHIRRTVKAIESEHMTFRLEISEVGILILEESGKYLVRYSTPGVSVIELDNCFTVCVSREKVFVIPKRCIEPEKMDEIRRRMKDGLGDRYEDKTVK